MKFTRTKTFSLFTNSILCAFILKVPPDPQTGDDDFHTNSTGGSSRGWWEFRSGVLPVFNSPSPLISCGNPITAVSGTAGCSSCNTNAASDIVLRKAWQETSYPSSHFSSSSSHLIITMYLLHVASHQSVLDLRRAETMTADVDDIIHASGYLVVTVLWAVRPVAGEITTWQKQTSAHRLRPQTEPLQSFSVTDQDTVWNTPRWTSGGLHRCSEPSRATAGWYTELHWQSYLRQVHPDNHTAGYTTYRTVTKYRKHTQKHRYYMYHIVP